MTQIIEIFPDDGLNLTFGALLATGILLEACALRRKKIKLLIWGYATLLLCAIIHRDPVFGLGQSIFILGIFLLDKRKKDNKNQK